jgi:hypothetical protein
MIAFLAVAATLAALVGLGVLALVVGAVRQEDRALRLPVEAAGPIAALVRRILGLHVRRTPSEIPNCATTSRSGSTERR